MYVDFNDVISADRYSVNKIKFDVETISICIISISDRFDEYCVLYNMI